MTWFSVLPAALVCLLVLFLPGALVLSALGSSGIARWAPAPLVTAALVGSIGIVAGMLGLPWNIWIFMAFWLFIVAILWIVRFTTMKSGFVLFVKPKNWRPNLGTVLGVAIGASVQGAILISAFVSPLSIAQRFDNVFHLNAIRWIIDTQNASSLVLNRMTGNEGPVAIYPAVWHGLAALLVQLTAIPVPAAANVLNLVIGAFVWPFGCVFLARTVLGRRLAHQLVAGAAATTFAVFPLAILDFGPLYPNILSYSLVPIALGVLISLLGLARLGPFDWLTVVVLLGATCVSLMLSQPNGLVTFLVIAVPLLISNWAAGLNRLRSSAAPFAPLARHWALLVVAGALGLVIWNFLRPNDPTGGWPPIQPTGAALGESLLNGSMGRLPAWVITAFIFLGLFIAAQRPKIRWIVGSYVLSVALFVVAASAPAGEVRSWFTGGWYNDSYRLAAILPITGILLAAVSADAAARVGGHWLRRLPFRSNILRCRAMGLGYTSSSVLLVVAILVGVKYSAVPPAMHGASDAYTDGSSARLLSSDEYALMRRLPQEVPKGAVVAVNPWNGGALAYAISDTQVTLRHLISEIPEGIDTIDKSINVSTPGSPACVVSLKLNVRFVLDFGENTFLNSPAAHGFDGLRSDRGSTLRLVDEQGAAKLLEIVGC